MGAQPPPTDPFASAPTAADPWGLGMPSATQSTTNTTAPTAAANLNNPWGPTTVDSSQTLQQSQPQATGFAADPWGEQTAPATQQAAPASSSSNVPASSFDPWGNSNSNATANITPTPVV